jgi:release factor glutamine methyltransferase
VSAQQKDPPKRLLDYLRLAGDHLRAKGVQNDRLDAELLLAEALGMSRVELYTSHERPLSTDEVDRFRELLRRRAAREPVAYILGKREFWSLELAVDRRVLIPRPETETLVETAVRACTGRLAASTSPTRYETEVVTTDAAAVESDAAAVESGADASLRAGPAAKAVKAKAERGVPLLAERVLDIGTGSGAVAVALAVELPGLNLVATDESAATLEVAPRNAQRHGVAERIDFRCGDLFTALESDEVFDVIVSNPPYVKDDEISLMEPEVKDWEPRGALFSGADGMRETARIIDGAPRHLKPEGWLLLEVGTQAEDVRARLARGGWRDVRSFPDLAGRDRVVAARRPLDSATTNGDEGG